MKMTTVTYQENVWCVDLFLFLEWPMRQERCGFRLLDVRLEKMRDIQFETPDEYRRGNIPASLYCSLDLRVFYLCNRISVLKEEIIENNLVKLKFIIINFNVYISWRVSQHTYIESLNDKIYINTTVFCIEI